MKTEKSEIIDQKSYDNFINQIKSDIKQSQLRAATAVTKELSSLYWRIGKQLSEKVSREGWGSKAMRRIASDLSSSYPDTSGFSFRNLQYMRKFAESYPDPNCATAVAQLPWGHNVILLDKLEKPEQRLWYASKAIEYGWSRSMLSMWIESNLYKREGKAITNFQHTLPQPQSDLAEQTLKDPYNFQFLCLSKKFEEEELEKGLTDHIQKFLIELGQGFAFVGRQYLIEVDGRTFRIDLLFYHLKLRCYFVVDLKATEFDPRDIGQMSFYLSAVDDLLRHPQDAPTIGIILCKTKSKIVAEYTLRNLTRPVGISSYETQLVESLPEALQGSLPSIEEIEEELSRKIPISEEVPL